MNFIIDFFIIFENTKILYFFITLINILHVHT